MRLWKSCEQVVDKAVDKFPAKVIHIFFHRNFHRFSTGFAQPKFLDNSLISERYRLIPILGLTTTITTIGNI